MPQDIEKVCRGESKGESCFFMFALFFVLFWFPKEQVSHDLSTGNLVLRFATDAGLWHGSHSPRHLESRDRAHSRQLESNLLALVLSLDKNRLNIFARTADLHAVHLDIGSLL